MDIQSLWITESSVRQSVSLDVAPKFGRVSLAVTVSESVCQSISPQSAGQTTAGQSS